MKKLIFIIIPLIAFGFLLAVFYIPGSQETTSASNPDNPGDPSVIDSFTNTNMISSNENLIVDTTAGQVKLSDVCYGIADNTQVPGCNEVCQACQTGACGVANAGSQQPGCTGCYFCDGEGYCVLCHWVFGGWIEQRGSTIPGIRCYWNDQGRRGYGDLSTCRSAGSLGGYCTPGCNTAWGTCVCD